MVAMDIVQARQKRVNHYHARSRRCRASLVPLDAPATQSLTPTTPCRRYVAAVDICLMRARRSVAKRVPPRLYAMLMRYERRCPPRVQRYHAGDAPAPKTAGGVLLRDVDAPQDTHDARVREAQAAKMPRGAAESEAVRHAKSAYAQINRAGMRRRCSGGKERGTKTARSER